jgi:glutamate synthase (NADPH) small chain
MESPRILMRERAPLERVSDFKEVNLGYSDEEACREARRCLKCKDRPCVDGCPVSINIPDIISAIADAQPEVAAARLKQRNRLAAVCGRVCQHENQCEKHCSLGKQGKPIAIGYLERYVADWEKTHGDGRLSEPRHDPSSPRVAVVGSGPAGLSCAAELSRSGFKVTMFESLSEPGGMLRYGVPEFRLPKDILNYEVENLRAQGVEIITNLHIGQAKTTDDLFGEGYEAVFLGVGPGIPKFLRVPGENLGNVYTATEFLRKLNLTKGGRVTEQDTYVPKGKNVAVIGGGNTALDSARTAVRLGAAKVTLFYRRSRLEMTSPPEEIRHAEQEGVQFAFLREPVAFRGDGLGSVNEIECRKTELGAPDKSGRPSPLPVSGSEFVLPAEMVIKAIGLSPNPLIPSLTFGPGTNQWKGLKIGEDLMTSRRGVFAGGHITGSETVIQAMGLGKQAAQHIKEYIFDKRLEC